MADLLALSERVIDHGEYAGPGSVNRITTELSEVADGIAVVESFSHVVAFRTGEGLVLFDTSLDTLAPACLASLRGWSDAPIRSIVYTHGHRDHAAGHPHLPRRGRGPGRRPTRDRGPRERGPPLRPLRADRRLQRGHQRPPVR